MDAVGAFLEAHTSIVEPLGRTANAFDSPISRDSRVEVVCNRL